MVYHFNVSEAWDSGIPKEPTAIEKHLSELDSWEDTLSYGVYYVLNNSQIAEICKEWPLFIKEDQNQNHLYLGYAKNAVNREALCFFNCPEEKKDSNEMKFCTISKGNLAFVDQIIKKRFGITAYEDLYQMVNSAIALKKKTTAIALKKKTTATERVNEELKEILA